MIREAKAVGGAQGTRVVAVFQQLWRADSLRQSASRMCIAVIAACDGDVRATIRALLIANAFLAGEVEALNRATWSRSTLPG